MELLMEYFKIQKQVHDYFGYTEDWVAIPLDDGTEYFWHLTGEGCGSEVLFAKNKDNLVDGTDEDGYASQVYTQRFLPKWVYRGKDYTMIVVDTQTDGNKFLQVFDNSKEICDVSKQKEVTE